ncbi:hypothetical protein AX774_g2238 [Zancudomyces culisetae]|uniref:Uncharacterized protein n=1 Tax=Zancudomyces culisetae TaxID=1213189 RepID=A0A1R1PTG0_ZANCU|nr:hypothetical protein AX774_g2238 [Zancudomyces culisetae]|eukprot:OMH84241.1 hypothetical protein AX774_g2238 [Zancudomyces culisetae]
MAISHLEEIRDNSKKFRNSKQQDSESKDRIYGALNNLLMIDPSDILELPPSLTTEEGIRELNSEFLKLFPELGTRNFDSQNPPPWTEIGNEKVTHMLNNLITHYPSEMLFENLVNQLGDQQKPQLQLSGGNGGTGSAKEPQQMNELKVDEQLLVTPDIVRMDEVGNIIEGRSKMDFRIQDQQQNGSSIFGGSSPLNYRDSSSIVMDAGGSFGGQKYGSFSNNIGSQSATLTHIDGLSPSVLSDDVFSPEAVKFEITQNPEDMLNENITNSNMMYEMFTANDTGKTGYSNNTLHVPSFGVSEGRPRSPTSSETATASQVDQCLEQHLAEGIGATVSGGAKENAWELENKRNWNIDNYSISGFNFDAEKIRNSTGVRSNASDSSDVTIKAESAMGKDQMSIYKFLLEISDNIGLELTPLQKQRLSKLEEIREIGNSCMQQYLANSGSTNTNQNKRQACSNNITISDTSATARLLNPEQSYIHSSIMASKFNSSNYNYNNDNPNNAAPLSGFEPSFNFYSNTSTASALANQGISINNNANKGNAEMVDYLSRLAQIKRQTIPQPKVFDGSSNGVIYNPIFRTVNTQQRSNLSDQDGEQDDAQEKSSANSNPWRLEDIMRSDLMTSSSSESSDSEDDDSDAGVSMSMYPELDEIDGGRDHPASEPAMFTLNSVRSGMPTSSLASSGRPGSLKSDSKLHKEVVKRRGANWLVSKIVEQAEEYDEADDDFGIAELAKKFGCMQILDKLCTADRKEHAKSVASLLARINLLYINNLLNSSINVSQ